MEKILVFGHKNPDTDTICSSIALAELQKKIYMLPLWVLEIFRLSFIKLKNK